MSIPRTSASIAAGVIIAASLALSGCSALGDLLSPTAEERDENGTIVDGGTTDIFTLTVGDCLVEDGGTQVSDVPTVPCDQPHAFEVYADTTMDPGEYPGEDAITAKADEVCGGAFDSFVGLAYADSALDYSYYFPTQESWEGVDDRVISCIITDPSNSEITGSLAGAAY